MSKALRLSERWYRFGLWLVAVAFASFLIGLGSDVVANLPHVERDLALDDFIGDRPAVDALRSEIRVAEGSAAKAREAHEQAQLKLDSARSDAATAGETFDNWLATRHATQRPEQDAELIARSAALDKLKAAERAALADVQAQQQALLDIEQGVAHSRQRLAEFEDEARERLWDAQRDQELRVFGYRLALTLPLLAVAGWLFARKRKSTWWPFVWGFIYFALFAFFFELVPYLPSYGGWIRSVVGIVVTVLVGRYAIVALNRYLEKQKQAEALPDVERRKELSYDTALARLGKKVCPGCERAVDLSDPAIDYCPHCGICLFDHCTACNERKSAFARFCHACGALAGQHAKD